MLISFYKIYFQEFIFIYFGRRERTEGSVEEKKQKGSKMDNSLAMSKLVYWVLLIQATTITITS